MNMRTGAAALGLLLLGPLAWADTSPTNQPSPPPLVVAPGGSVAPVTPALPVQPQPVPSLPVPSPAVSPVLSTAPVSIIATPPVPKPQPPPLGSELRGKLKVDEEHFNEKSAAARKDFDLREAEEKKAFEATLADAGFWERRRLTRAFRGEQAKRARLFNDEQEAKRKTYEWRYP